MNRKSDPRLSFMLSNWYSGATLFAILLNNHNQVTCNGETFPFRPKDADNYICSCGKSLIECEFYKEAAAHMIDNEKRTWDREVFVVLLQFSKNTIIDKWLKSFRHMYQLPDITIDLFPKYRRKTKRFLDAHLQFFVNSCEHEGSTVYVDGTKSVRRAELFSKHSKSPFKIIHLIRDGRGFCYSYIKNNRLPKEKLPQAAKAWLEYIQLVDIFSFRHPNIPVMTIRHEDLCRNPKAGSSDICEFLELFFDDNMSKGINKQYHILGNVMRKSFNGKAKENLS